MNIVASIFLLLIPLYLILLHIFAVVGLVFTVKYFYNRNISRKDQKVESSAKESVTKPLKEVRDRNQVRGFPTPAIIAKNIAEKPPIPPENNSDQPQKEDLTSPLQTLTKVKRKDLNGQESLEKRSSLLLYTGAILVGFAVFVFVVFNWDNYDQFMKSLLLTIFIAFFFLLSYLFSLKNLYAQVSKTFLILGSIALILGGIGYWKFYLQFHLPELGINGIEFWLIYSSLLLVVFYLIQKVRHSKLFSLFFIFSAYSFAISLGMSIYDGRGIMQMALILIISGAFTDLFARGESIGIHNHRFALGFSRFFVVVTNILFTLSLLSEGFYSVELHDKVILTWALLSSIPYLKLLHRKGEDIRVESFIEGLLVPLKGIILIDLFFLAADSYHHLAISLVLFIISVVLILRRSVPRSSLKVFSFSLFFSTLIASLILPFIKPVYVESLQAIPIVISYSIISVAIQILSNKSERWYLRFPNIPLDLVVFVGILYAIEERTSLGITDIGIIGLMMTLPAVLYTWEGMISEGRKKIPLFVGASLFAILSMILTSTQSDLFIFTTLFSMIFFKVLTLNSGKSFHQIPMVISSYLFILALGLNFGWEQSLALLLMMIFTIFLGVVGMIREKVGVMKNTYFNSNFLKYLTLPFVGLFYMINLSLLFDLSATIQGEKIGNSRGEPLIFFSSLLFSFYFLLVWKGNRFLKYFAGVGLVPAFWYIVRLSDTSVYANAQLFVFPLMIYSLVLAYTLDKKHMILSKFFFILAYMLPATVALYQSLRDPSPYDLYHGLALLLISAAVLVYATLKKEKLLSIIAVVYILIELFLLFWETIRSIPWWAYVGLLGLLLIALAVYIIFKFATAEEKGSISETEPLAQDNKNLENNEK